ncbi:hypothetical protein SLS62_007036 [Diatrype stigma]|uniref:Pre-mRNA-splicing factor 18 n=1 Tax=Diatrype stigma TaxID=117547 RepID=A0AAN9UQ13_9PEZI
MDFAALMAKEIAKAKVPPTSKPAATTTTTTSTENESTAAQPPTKKYMRRSEAEAAREAAYRAEQAALEQKRAQKVAEKRKREEEALEESRAREEKRRRLEDETRRRREEAAAAEERARRKRLGLPETPPPRAGSEAAAGSSGGEGGGEDEDVPDEELVRRLRELGEPATVFGESHRRRLRRYRRLTTVVTSGPIPTTLRLLDEADMKVDGTVPSGREARRYLFRQLASYFTMVLREWEAALAREQKSAAQDQTPTHQTFASKAAVSAMTSSRDNMRPLFRKFEAGDLDDDVLGPVVEIVKAAQERRYVDANDGYLRLSIGKAAWPIGVTMVGIHERSAREKLHDGSERSHILGDEVTRKYLQSIKRCLTFAQVRWPPEDIRQLMG